MDDRHARTRLLLDTHLPASRQSFSAPVRIEIEPADAAHPDGQLTLLTAVNMVARFTDNIHLQIPLDTKLATWVPWGTAPDLASRASEIASSFAQAAPTGDPVITLRVGSSDASAKGILVRTTSQGWAAYASTDPKAQLPARGATPNPAGALVAACLASAQVFRAMVQSLGGTSLPDAEDYAVLNALTLKPERGDGLPPLPAHLNLGPGQIVIVGGGSVAHGFIYACRAMNVAANILIVEPGKFKSSGENRYLLAPAGTTGSKALHLAHHAQPGHLDITPFEMEYRPWRAQDRRPLRIAVSTVDDTQWNRGRKDLQTDLPRTLITAATGRDRLTVATIDFLNGPCLGCLVPEAPANQHIAHTIAGQTKITVERAMQLFYEGQPLQEGETRLLAAAMRKPFDELAHLVGRPGTEALRSGDLCGLSDIPLPDGTAQASISFLSGLAGILAALEALKVETPGLASYVHAVPVCVLPYLPSKVDRRPGKLPERCSVDCTHPVLREEWRTQWVPNAPTVSDAPL